MKRIAVLGALGALVVSALAGAAYLVLGNPSPVEAYAREVAQRASVRFPAADATTFRAIVCANEPCVIVEAGGLRFLVGAGADAAEDIVRLGLAREYLDALLLTDLSARSVAGLPSIRRLFWRAGRTEPLDVIGPPGVEQVIDGANLLMAAADVIDIRSEPAGRLSLDGAGLQRKAHGQSPRRGRLTVFDTGVVSIQAFLSEDRQSGLHWLYRFDVGGNSLIVGDCSAGAEAIAAASEGAGRVAAILPARSLTLLSAVAAQEGLANTPLAAANGDPTACRSASEWSAIQSQAVLSAVLFAPLDPAADTRLAARAWRANLKDDPAVALGIPGSRIDLTGQGFKITLSEPAN